MCNTASTYHGLEYPPTGRDRKGRYREIFKLLISCANLISDWTGTIPRRRKLPSQLSSFAKFSWGGWDGGSSERHRFSFYIFFCILVSFICLLKKIEFCFGNLWQKKHLDAWSFFSGHVNRFFFYSWKYYFLHLLYYISPQSHLCSAQSTRLKRKRINLCQHWPTEFLPSGLSLLSWYKAKIKEIWCQYCTFLIPFPIQGLLIYFFYWENLLYLIISSHNVKSRVLSEKNLALHAVSCCWCLPCQYFHIELCEGLFPPN